MMATQNPIEQEGTYPLPEAQLDRFLMHVNVDYPDASAEMEILRLTRAEASHKNAPMPTPCARKPSSPPARTCWPCTWRAPWSSTSCSW